ncbi:NACHT domain-containing protein [Colletotrichum kahawae]|uniref:NACHT domain-containing protein n=1 Tax=Colletotrichum kahawae TaxID=34407 RepID=A0AAD9YSJ2_COLKA|nr:NACHT domain-containing protein [Colletotrichum kahawae]
MDELRVAVNVEPGSIAWNSSTLVGSGLRLAALYGGSLLDIDEEDLCVRFIHHSALLHLLSPPAIQSAAAFHFNFQDAEVTFGAVCVTYLNYAVFENRLSTAQKVSFSRVPELVTDSVLLSKKTHRFQVNEDVHIFFAYATENWIAATKVFSEDVDQGVYNLWASLPRASTPAVSFAVHN